MKSSQNIVQCQICKKRVALDDAFEGSYIREPIVATIRKEHPDWTDEEYICKNDLNHYRALYVKSVLEAEKGELTTLEKDVLESIKEHELLSDNINTRFDRKLTFGERLSDTIAEFGGSWTFIIIFFIIMLTWITINGVAIFRKPFDPYPFILLNLVLSCLAAIQAPIIMMSQNRQEAKDRLHSENDYRINLKAELEIRHLHEKLDHLIMNQWDKLLEIQDIQIQLLEELTNKKEVGK